MMFVGNYGGVTAKEIEEVLTKKITKESTQKSRNGARQRELCTA